MKFIFKYDLCFLFICSLIICPFIGVAQSPHTSAGNMIGTPILSGDEVPLENMTHKDTIAINELRNATVGTVQEIPGEKIKLFPNPAQDFFNIDGENVNLTIRIFDQKGKFYRQITNRGTPIKIAVSSLLPGAYLIKIYDHEKDVYYTKKLIKL